MAKIPTINFATLSFCLIQEVEIAFRNNSPKKFLNKKSFDFFLECY